MVVEPPVNNDIFAKDVHIILFSDIEHLEKVRLNLAWYLSFATHTGAMKSAMEDSF